MIFSTIILPLPIFLWKGEALKVLYQIVITVFAGVFLRGAVDLLDLGELVLRGVQQTVRQAVVARRFFFPILRFF